MRVWVPVMLWFACSAVASTYFNTKFLQVFAGDSRAHTLIRFVGSATIGLLNNQVLLLTGGGGGVGVGDAPMSLDKFRSSLLPCLFPAVCLLCANLFNSVSLDLGGITLTYVVKAGIPLVTVLICLVWFGQRCSWRILLTFVPIVTGVALSAVADSQFSWPGFAAAWVSTIAQASLNVSSKAVIASAKLSGQRFQFVLVSIGSVALVGLALLAPLGDMPAMSMLRGGKEEGAFSQAELWLLAVAVAVTYHVEYVLNFIVTDCFSPVYFSVLDVVRRLSIILCGAAMFHKDVSVLNAFGVVLALAGVVVFSVVKRREEEEAEQHALALGDAPHVELIVAVVASDAKNE